MVTLSFESVRLFLQLPDFLVFFLISFALFCYNGLSVFSETGLEWVLFVK